MGAGTVPLIQEIVTGCLWFQLILVGAGTRVPRIQEMLQDRWGRELGKSVNTDEAAALGAVYRAADLSTGFKVMKFHIKDYVKHPIGVSNRHVRLHLTAALAPPPAVQVTAAGLPPVHHLIHQSTESSTLHRLLK